MIGGTWDEQLATYPSQPDGPLNGTGGYHMHIYGRLRLGPSTTLVLDSGSRVRDYKCIRSSMWETLAKSARLTHPQATNHSLNFSNLSPTAHVGAVSPAAVFQILSSMGGGTDFSFDAVFFLYCFVSCIVVLTKKLSLSGGPSICP